MKQLITYIGFSFLFALALMGCREQKGIVGIVNDIFGNPISDVSVGVENSAFSSMTDDSGNYSLDYAPGVFDVVFSKSGYTVSSLSLNIQQESRFPAEAVILYPIPAGEGVFYVGEKQLIKLPTSLIKEIKNPKKGGMFANNYKFTASPVDEPVNIPSGKISFIDTVKGAIMPTPLGKTNIVYESNGSSYDQTPIYNKFFKDSLEKTSSKALTIRTTEDLKPGAYVFARLKKIGPMGALGCLPVKDSDAYHFTVIEKSN